MTVLVDTRTMPERDRAQALQAAHDSVTAPVSVEVGLNPEFYMQAWQFGQGGHLLQARADCAYRLRRTARHVRIGAPERVAVAVSDSPACATWQKHAEWSADQLQLVDLSSEHEISWRGKSSTVSLEVDLVELALPVDRIRAAGPLLQQSPLYAMVRQHLIALPRAAARLDEGPRAMLTASTTELVRALVASVASQGVERRAVRDSSLHARILTYVEQHLADPGLSPQQLATVHGVSLRHVYSLFAGEAESPAAAISTRRLEGARRELAHRADERPVIAGVARRWGYTDPGTFSRQFRRAYGLTPQEWVRRSTIRPADQ